MMQLYNDHPAIKMQLSSRSSNTTPEIVNTSNLTEDQLENALFVQFENGTWINNNQLIEGLLQIMRFIVIYQFATNIDQFEFLFETRDQLQSTLENYAKLGNLAEQTEVICLSNIFKKNIFIFQLDRDYTMSTYKVPEDQQEADIVLLFRPGHYDLLYQTKRVSIIGKK